MRRLTAHGRPRLGWWLVADTQAHMLENSSANPSQEIVRLLISMLARHPEWVALVLDIACAFLNAELGDEKVLIRPPPVLVRMGLIAPHVLWLALRAIYGLRKAPKLWEEERNRILDHRVVNIHWQCCNAAFRVWCMASAGEWGMRWAFHDVCG